jgi:hypothetical protein
MAGRAGAAGAAAPAAGTSPKFESIGLWTNKGGVGKTTLSFHLSTMYAYLNPSKRVVVLDMCPQANLSNTLLTSLSPARAELQAALLFTPVAAPHQNGIMAFPFVSFSLPSVQSDACLLCMQRGDQRLWPS